MPPAGDDVRGLTSQGGSPEESETYRTALDSDEALRAVYRYYRAIPLWMRERLDPVPMPTLFIWPTGSENVASASIEANANWSASTRRGGRLFQAHSGPQKRSDLVDHEVDVGGLIAKPPERHEMQRPQ